MRYQLNLTNKLEKGFNGILSPLLLQ